MTGPSDETALIERARSGDREAFEALVRGHYDAMYRMAFKWCGDKADAEDITQNACIKLARSIGTFRFQSAFRTWLYRLVINTAKDWAKARPRRTTDHEIETGRAEAPAGEDRVYAMQVMAYVQTMPDREKSALLLVFGEGLSHREAAAAMDCKESTVSWYIHEARKKLHSFQNQERRYG
jgi:RNA polymerase sigma-70 factor (ECF subfamily)